MNSRFVFALALCLFSSPVWAVLGAYESAGDDWWSRNKPFISSGTYVCPDYASGCKTIKGAGSVPCSAPSPENSCTWPGYSGCYAVNTLYTDKDWGGGIMQYNKTVTWEPFGSYGCGRFVLSGSACAAGLERDPSSGLCHTPCVAPATWDTASQSCTVPPCPTGDLAHFNCLTAGTTACLAGCSYSVSAGTQTSVGFFGSGQSSGSTCTASGCSEVTQQERDAICTGTEASLLLRQILCDVTAQPCPEGQIPSPAGCAEPLPDGCIAIEGETICAEADQNCVVVAGQRVCAEVPESELDREGCFWSLALGEWICATDTAVTGTTSTTSSVVDPVTGNKTTTTTTTTTNNVTNQSTMTTTSVVTDPDGNEISRESVETKTGSEIGSLVAREAAELGEKADLDWLMTEEEVKTAWADRWEAAPIVAAVSSFSDLSLTAVDGSCPEFCLPLWGESLCTTAHCEIWETISAVLTGVLLALYGMTAMRIVLSA